MIILAVESSAGPASAAIVKDGEVLSSEFINTNLTHSETLLPLVEKALKKANLTLSSIDRFAVSSGPGSFTGLRIGIALIKGLATPENSPTAGVSTLLAMAANHKDSNCLLCTVMDARCNQVYNALFKIENGEIKRLTPDRALMCEELAAELKEKYANENIVVMGDGYKVFMPYVKDFASLSSEDKIYQNAVGVALMAENFEEPAKLTPVYLRLPQAERELKLKKERGN